MAGGCAKSVKDVRAIVGAIVAKKQGVVVSHGWWDRFRQRHPHLARCVLVKLLPTNELWLLAQRP